MNLLNFFSTFGLFLRNFPGWLARRGWMIGGIKLLGKDEYIVTNTEGSIARYRGEKITTAERIKWAVLSVMYRIELRKKDGKLDGEFGAVTIERIEQKRHRIDLPTSEELMTAPCEIKVSEAEMLGFKHMSKEELVKIVIGYGGRIELICNALDAYHGKSRKISKR
jgi:hypothetical protein